MHTKHVSEDRIVSQSRLNAESFRWCHVALDTLENVVNASTCVTTSSSSNLIKPDGRMMWVDPSWVRIPVRQT